MSACRSYRERSSGTVGCTSPSPSPHHVLPHFHQNLWRLSSCPFPPFPLTMSADIPDATKFITLATATGSNTNVIAPITARNRNPANPNQTKRACSSAKSLSFAARLPKGSSWEDGGQSGRCTSSRDGVYTNSRDGV